MAPYLREDSQRQRAPQPSHSLNAAADPVAFAAPAQVALAAQPGSEPRPAHRPHRVTRAMARFACISDRCEDTCCRDWGVGLDRADVERLRGAMAGAPAGGARLVRLVVIGRPSPDAAHATAHIGMNEHGACPELDAQHKCRTQIDFGADALPKPCAVFPRTSLDTEDGLEVGGSLACPEVARLTLLDPEAFVFEPAPDDVLPRAFVGKAIASDPANPWTRLFMPVRAALLDIFRQTDFSVRARLGAAAVLADATAGAYHPHSQASQAWTGNFGAFAERRFLEALAAGVQPAALQQAEADLAAVDMPAGPVMGFVMSLLTGRRELPHPLRFAHLLQRVFATYEAGVLGRPARAEDAVTAEDFARVYVQRRQQVDARFGAETGLIFGNLCQHHLVRHPFTEAASLLDALGLMGLEVATLRMLFVGHPDVVAAAAAPARDIEHGRARIKAAAVEVVQTYSKAVSHHPGFRDTMAHALGGSQPMTFGKLVLLAKFV